VHCAAVDRQALAQLCCTITRPALASDRAQCNAAGQVMLKRMTSWRHCLNCSGEHKIIATILKQPVIEKTLANAGLQALAPPRAPALGQALQAA
jgi:hypothetical protein